LLHRAMCEIRNVTALHGLVALRTIRMKVAHVSPSVLA
jgi:hypothetical protein